MIYKLAYRLAILSMKYNDTDNLANKETYIYGYEILIGKMITYTIIFIVGVAFNILAEVMIFIVFLVSLRGQTGGFHLRTYSGCIVCSVMTCLISSLIANRLQPKLALTVLPLLFILSSVYIIVYSPINHPNLNLTLQEAVKCKKAAKRYLLIELIIMILLLLMNAKPSIIISACLAIILVAISMILAKIKKQEVSYYG